MAPRIPQPLKSKLILAPLIILLLGAILVLGLPQWINVNTYRNFIAEQLSRTLEQTVSIGYMDLNLIHGAGLDLREVKIGHGTPEALELNHILVTLKLLPLLHRELIVDRITLQSPEMLIQRDPKGDLLFPFRKLLLKKAEAPPTLEKVSIDYLTISRGRFIFTDEFAGRRYSIIADKVDLQLKNFKPGQPLDFSLQAELYQPGKSARNLIGIIDLNGQTKGLSRESNQTEQNPLETLWIGGTGKLTRWNLNHIQPYLDGHVPFVSLSGTAEGDLKFEGFPARKDLTLNLKTKAAAIRLDYPDIFANPLTAVSAGTDFYLYLKPNRQLSMDLKQLEIDSGAFQLRGELKLLDLLGERAGIYLKAEMTPVTVTEVHKYIAYAVIPPKVGEFMRRAFTDGVFSGLKVTLDGTFEEFANITQPQNNHVIQASGQIQDFKVNLPWESYALEKGTGQVKLEHGAVILENISGHLQNSLIQAHRVVMANVYTGSPYWDINSEFTLNWGDTVLDKLVPQITKNLTPYGQSRLRVKLNGPSGNLDVRGEAVLDKTGYDYRDWLHKTADWSNSLSCDLKISDLKDVEINRLSYNFKDSQILLSGHIGSHKDMKLNISGQRMALQDLTQLSPAWLTPQSRGILSTNLALQQQPGKNSNAKTSLNGSLAFHNANLTLRQHPLRLSGQGEGKFDLQFAPETAKIKGTLNLDQAVYSYSGWVEKPLSLPHHIAFDLALPPRQGVVINDLTVTLGADKLQLSGEIKDKTTLESELKVKGRLANLQNWRRVLNPKLGGKLDQVAGSLETNLNFKGPLNSPGPLNIKGYAEIKDAQIGDSAVPYNFQNVTARLNSLQGQSGTLDIFITSGSYKKLQLAKLSAMGNWQKNSPNAASGEPGDTFPLGAVSLHVQAEKGIFDQLTISGVDGDINWQKPELDINRLSITEISRPETALSLKGVLLNAAYKPDRGTSFHFQSREGIYKKIITSQLAGQGNWHNSALELTHLSGRAFDGTLNASGQFNIFENTSPGYTVNFDAKDIDTEKMFRQITDEKTVITGKMNLSGRLTSPGQTPGWFDRMNGQIKLGMEDGNIRRFKVLATIFTLINPISIIRAIPKLDEEGFPYYSINGDFKIADGVAATQNLILDSAAWKILALGEINLPQEKVDFKVYVQPWRTMDQIIDKIPVIGRILQGEKGSFLDTYFTVQGDFKSIDTTAHPISALAEDVWGIITRTLSLPIDILKAIPRPGAQPDKSP